VYEQKANTEKRALLGAGPMDVGRMWNAKKLKSQITTKEPDSVCGWRTGQRGDTRVGRRQKG
jgi:hypothetical protein